MYFPLMKPPTDGHSAPCPYRWKIGAPDTSAAVVSGRSLEGLVGRLRDGTTFLKAGFVALTAAGAGGIAAAAAAAPDDPREPRRAGGGGGGKATGDSSRDAPPSDSEDSDDERQSGPGDGRYQVKGQWFLEGTKHVDKLVRDTPVQIFFERDERWIDATIASVQVHSLAQDQEIRTFAAHIVRAGETAPTLLENLKAADFRLPCAGEGGEWLSPAAAVQAQVKAQTKIDSSTGMSGWSVVGDCAVLLLLRVLLLPLPRYYRYHRYHRYHCYHRYHRYHCYHCYHRYHRYHCYYYPY